MDAQHKKVRVENQPGISTSTYDALASGRRPAPLTRPFTVLLIKPYQPTRDSGYGPPLGLLLLISGLRNYFGSSVSVHFWDMKLYHATPDALASKLDELRPDVIGVSALNCEASSSFAISAIAKAWNPELLTIIGGPFTLRQAPIIFSNSQFDWVFEGAADRTLLQALERQFSGQELGNDIPGFSYRQPSGSICFNHQQDLITDLDSLPLPAWDVVDFDRYSKYDRKRIITNVGQRKYAYLFTSRGCPYLCNYCHDTFTKRFVYRSEASILEEIRLLHEDYGITEFHIVDDIFNLHRPRAISIMKAIGDRWPGKFFIAFPNGLRGDILDKDVIDAMVYGGTYQATISIETVSPRLQSLVEKNLDIERAKWAIEEFDRRGVIVQGAFMLGFPTETPEEIENTLSYAIRSPLTHAFFFSVIPQPNTPIYTLAMKENPEATLSFAKDERDDGDYNSLSPWYSRAYGYDLHSAIGRGFVRFYLHPRRVLKLVRRYRAMNLAIGLRFVLLRLLMTAAAPFRASPLTEIRDKPV
ncbi:MAG: Radical domain protein [Moraxellaceae bacterium]|nr:Radical domain protein [Moraxellaceae bacterium]